MSFDIVWHSHSVNPEANQAVCEFVATRIWGEARPFFLSTTMGVFEGGKLVAAVVFNNYDRAAGVLEMSAASDTPRWLTRPVLLAMFAFPFDELGCQAVVLRVDASNTRLARILTAYGFNRYEIPRLRGRDKPEVIFVLHDDVWRTNGFHKE